MNRRSFLAAIGLAPAMPLAASAAPASPRLIRPPQPISNETVRIWAEGMERSAEAALREAIRREIDAMAARRTPT